MSSELCVTFLGCAVPAALSYGAVTGYDNGLTNFRKALEGNAERYTLGATTIQLINNGLGGTASISDAERYYFYSQLPGIGVEIGSVGLQVGARLAANRWAAAQAAAAERLIVNRLTLEAMRPGGANTLTLGAGSSFYDTVTPRPLRLGAGVGERGGVTFEGTLYRAVPEGGNPLDISYSVAANGRYTAPGQGGLYFASNARTVEAEFVNNGSSLIGRTLNLFPNSSVDNLLDLTNPATRSGLGVSLRDLTRTGGTPAWRYEVTQPLGAFAQRNGYSGIIAPSAQADGSVNLILFGSKGVQ